MVCVKCDVVSFWVFWLTEVVSDVCGVGEAKVNSSRSEWKLSQSSSHESYRCDRLCKQQSQMRLRSLVHGFSLHSLLGPEI